ncbi:probable RNA-binding protein 18 [Phlebotomus argentipes]|uniref:probable RNA-binding protein 18 n=1 Tax=Phlebotomus argentipes TaxID=94469 RepID=UPI002892AC9A|nr:probable RNA-binding protein 18 [Phlebotomus argentipes]
MEKNPEAAEKRLWIGNLDTRVTEYQLVKILQKYGDIENFELVYHRTGPQAGQSRGYAFVTYKTRQNAATAIQKLTGKQIDGRSIAVGLAKTFSENEDRFKTRIEIPALGGAAGSSSGASVDRKKIAIQAIEAKLKVLESQRSGDDFEVNKSVSSEASLIQRYQFNKGQERSHRGTLASRQRQRHKHSGPYHRHTKR